MIQLRAKRASDGVGLGHVVLLIGLVASLGCQSPYRMPLPQPGQPLPQPISTLPIQPISQPGSPLSPPISLSGSAAQQATIRSALARCTFPFERLSPGLQGAGLRSVNISWQPMQEGTQGWASSGGEVAINNSIGGLQAQRTAILELGHAVDFFYLTPQMRKDIVRLWHPNTPDNDEWFGSTGYWNQVGEAYSTLFLWAFADEEMWFDAGYSHKPSKELALKLRTILLPEAVASRP